MPSIPDTGGVAVMEAHADSGSFPAVRLAGVAGIASVVLVVAGRLVAGSAPGVTGTSHGIFSYYASATHWHRQEAGLVLGALSMVFFLPFLGGLRARLRAGEGNGAGMSSVLLVAGGVFAALYAAISTMRGVISFALDGSHAFRAAALDPQMVRGLEEARSLFFVHALVAGAVLIAASSLLALRGGGWADWLSYLGLAIAALVLVGAFFVAGAVFLLLAWIVVAGIVLISNPRSSASRRTDST